MRGHNWCIFGLNLGRSDLWSWGCCSTEDDASPVDALFGVLGKACLGGEILGEEYGEGTCEYDSKRLEKGLVGDKDGLSS